MGQPTITAGETHSRAPAAPSSALKPGRGVRAAVATPLVNFADVVERINPAVVNIPSNGLSAPRAGDVMTLFVYSPELEQRQLKTVRVED